MAHHDEARLTEVLSEIVGDIDTKAVFRRLLQQALQELIETELTAAIRAAPHERSDTRTNPRNGRSARIGSASSVPSIDPEHEATEWDRGFAVAEEAPQVGGATSDATRQAVDDAVRRRERMVGQAHVRGESRLRQMTDKIEAAGGHALGEVGGPDPAAAVDALLTRHAFAEVIISTLPAGLSRWLKTDDLPIRVAHLTETPVTTVEAKP